MKDQLKKYKKIFIPLLILLVLLFVAFYFYNKSQYTVYTKISCSGFMGSVCPQGYRCQLEANSTGGWCVGNGWSPKLSEVTETYLKNPTVTKTFNETLKNKKRGFRFDYPSELTLVDVDSGSIHLQKYGADYMTIETVAALTTIKEGRTEEDKFKKLYLAFNNTFHDESIEEYKRIDLGNGNFTYKVFLTEPAMCGYEWVSQETPWSCYIAVIQGKGIALTNKKNISEKSIISLLKTISFTR